MTHGNHPLHAEITGPLVILGFGSIGRGALPLIERHIGFDKSRAVVVDPRSAVRPLIEEHGLTHVPEAVSRENYRELLTPLLTDGAGQGFCVNLSVDTSSIDLMRLCRKLGVLYIDSATETWPGFFSNAAIGNANRTTYALREKVRDEARANPGGATAVSCCGANPGMVSWLAKQALVNLAKDLGMEFQEPGRQDREGWARLMRDAGVKGIHVAERDSQRSRNPKPLNAFWNTWSVEGFIAESIQPVELGWGTHEKWTPANARRHDHGCQAAIYLEQPGGTTRVRSWCPTPGPQHGFLVPHDEAISIADFFTLRDKGRVEYRPTCHYAYHPANDAVLSLHEMFGTGGKPQPVHHILCEDELLDGADELGVLLYGHDLNAYWYGSQLSIEETRRLAPNQNATGLQVSSGVLAGMAWAIENPAAGIVDANEMDYKRCLEVQLPYLGPVKGYYTGWTPLDGRLDLFEEDVDTANPWQFRNVLVHEMMPVIRHDVRAEMRGKRRWSVPLHTERWI